MAEILQNEEAVALLKPLQLGNRTFPINLIQGPLAGVSCAPFRLLTWRYSEPAFTCTEMISCNTLNNSNISSRRYTAIAPQEGPVCFQLSSHDPQELAQATVRATALGASLIDLNCGCPVKKIRRKGAGSSLLADASKLYQMMRAMKENTTVPVSIKIRVDSAHDKNNAEIVKAVQDAGIDYLIVHGRHWTQHYETACQYDEIQYFVEALSIPVIGNGDIRCVQTLQKMFATGCAGVMIARAGVGQPWLIRQLIAEMEQETFTPPSPAEIGAIFIEHVTRLIELLDGEKFALFQARNIAKYYARGLKNRAEFCEAMNTCETLVTFSNLVHQYFL